jgi:hypothetical protein
MEWGTHVKRVVVLAGLAATTVLAAAACGGGSTGGFPTTAPTTTSQATDSTGSNTSSSSGGGQTLDASKPCALLSSSDLTELGSTSTPYQDKQGPDNACELGTSTFTASVVTNTRSGVSQVDSGGGTMKDVPVNGRSGKEIVNSGGANGCLIAIPVTQTSHVAVVVQMSDPSATAQQACTPALQVAKLVEPHLPPES